jgi:hypothetical protein
MEEGKKKGRKEGRQILSSHSRSIDSKTEVDPAIWDSTILVGDSDDCQRMKTTAINSISNKVQGSGAVDMKNLSLNQLFHSAIPYLPISWFSHL